jgi:hypothetical protein
VIVAYPETIDIFPEKLNKKSDVGLYVVEEELPVTEGVFEGILAHDNINNSTIRVFTGPKLTGNEIMNVMVSIPGDTPWRRHIKIFSDVPTVYVTYETPGDTVEAGDVNALQAAVTATQIELERYKQEGVIDGGDFI